MHNGIIKPQKVDKGAWRRWLNQGGALVGRSPAFWLALMSGLMLLLPWAGVLQPVVMLLAFCLGFNLAVAVDFETASHDRLRRFGQLYGDAARFSLQVGGILLLAAIPLLGLLLLGRQAAQALAFGHIDATALQQLRHILGHYLPHVSDGLVVWGSFVLVGYVFVYPLRTLGADFSMALVQAFKSHWLNFGEFARIGGACILSALGLSALGLDILAPLLYAFWTAVGYVMFREVFLGITQNQVQTGRVPQSGWKPLLPGISRTAGVSGPFRASSLDG